MVGGNVYLGKIEAQTVASNEGIAGILHGVGHKKMGYTVCLRIIPPKRKIT
jgi:hypothetical protein